ncbi:hypothetical protein C8F01DRAFT_1105187 [Mycena amicta]|nr:hypothetical protein C8F01DRAFT_1105187 [Mycena amicta]
MPPRKKQKTAINDDSTTPSSQFPSSEELRRAENRYQRALELRALEHTRGKATLAEELVELDRWLVDGKNGLRGKLGSGLTKADLTSLMKWKLSRGKSRPTLLALIASNSDELVRSATTKALETLRAADEDIEKGLLAIPMACVLKGVGAATASALLTLQPPHLIPFMSDEAAGFFERRLGPVKYTDAYYYRFARAMHVEVQRLNSTESSDDKWDAMRLERALFCACILQREQH